MKDDDPWSFPSYSKLNELIYLHATLSETLRFYPPLSFNHKASVKPDILPSGHCIGKDTVILIPYMAWEGWKKSGVQTAVNLKPERWISEKQTMVDVLSFKYSVFGAGL